MAYQWRKGIPCPKRNHESEPGEEKDAAIWVERVERGYSPGLAVDRVHLRGRVQVRKLDTHCERLPFFVLTANRVRPGRRAVYVFALVRAV